MTSAAFPTISGTDLAPGFADPVHDAQAVFRAVLRAMSRPGEVQDLSLAFGPGFAPPVPLAPASAAACLALLDLDTRLWLDGGGRDVAAALAYLSFHTGAPRTETTAEADFAVVTDGAMTPRLNCFSVGTDELPERSTTLIVQVAALESGDADGAGEGGWRLTGPGIDGRAYLSVDGLRKGLAGELALNSELFPRGVDLILCAGPRLVALPRTTRIEEV